jgi:hypothetical protein
MQVKATASAPVSSVSVAVDPAEFDTTGPVAVYVAPIMPLSLDDLVMALLLSAATTEDVAAMDDEQVRHEVAFTLAVEGLSAVHDAVTHDRASRCAGAVERRHVELCRSRIAAAFGLAAAPATRRSRIRDAVARQRRIVVRAA